MQRLGFLFIVAFFCSGRPGALAGTGPQRVLASLYGFSVEVPSGWSYRFGRDGLPVFVNFEWSKMQAQLRLPQGGATVNIVAWDTLLRRKGDESLAGWARLDAVNAAPGTFTSHDLHAPLSSKISEAILVSFDEATFGPDDQAQRQINAYWAFQPRRFAAHLSFVVGDPKGSEYENVLRDLVLSVRPL